MSPRPHVPKDSDNKQQVFDDRIALHSFKSQYIDEKGKAKFLPSPTKQKRNNARAIRALTIVGKCCCRQLISIEDF